jgi:hypothetical protein
MNFKQFREQLELFQEQTVKKYKTGKGNKIDVEIKKVGNKFEAHIDGERLDSFSNQKAAEKGVEDFIKLMDA